MSRKRSKRPPSPINPRARHPVHTRTNPIGPRLRRARPVNSRNPRSSISMPSTTSRPPLRMPGSPAAKKSWNPSDMGPKRRTAEESPSEDMTAGPAGDGESTDETARQHQGRTEADAAFRGRFHPPPGDPRPGGLGPAVQNRLHGRRAGRKRRTSDPRRGAIAFARKGLPGVGREALSPCHFSLSEAPRRVIFVALEGTVDEGSSAARGQGAASPSATG